MKVAERKRKYKEFVRISQMGTLGSSETAQKLGISINTLYNWRKRLRTESQSIPKSVQPKPDSPFSKIAIEPPLHIVDDQSFIEVTIGNTIVMRIPTDLPGDTLHTILVSCVNRYKR